MDKNSLPSNSSIPISMNDLMDMIEEWRKREAQLFTIKDIQFLLEVVAMDDGRNPYYKPRQLGVGGAVVRDTSKALQMQGISLESESKYISAIGY